MSSSPPASLHRGRPSVWWWLRTVAMVVFCAFSSVLALGVAVMRFEEAAAPQDVGTTPTLWMLAAVPVALTVAVLLGWRSTMPYVVTGSAAGAAILFPLDAAAALFALAALIRVRTGRGVWVGATAVAVATTVAVVRDASGETTDSSVLNMLGAPPEPGATVEASVPWWGQLLVVLVLLAASVGSGLLMRSRRDLADSRTRMIAEQSSRGRLSEQLGRQAERERIAREVHDVIGHRLSLLSLHAGALEVAAGQDPKLARSAALVRQGAQESMDDLRSLLTVLREPEALGSATATPSLAELPAVIEETVQSGMPVVSTVYLTRAEEAGEGLSRGVYRIVQELLTNARRHAPGAPVRLLVQGSPEHGIQIETANRLVPTAGREDRGGPDDAVRQDGAGHGLMGITERAEMLGGQVRHGVDSEGAFRVGVWLPWTGAEETAAR